MLPGSVKQPRLALLEATLQMQLLSISISELQRYLHMIGRAVTEQ